MFLNIVELVEKFSNKEMVTSEGYGGENKNGPIPEYLDQRLQKESTYIENSGASYDTWDSYSLRKPKDVVTDLAIIYISHRKTRGSSFTVFMVPVKEIVTTKYEADWAKYRELNK